MRRLLYISHEYTEHDWRFLCKLSLEYRIWYLRTGPVGITRERRRLPPGVTMVDWVMLVDNADPFSSLKRCQGKFERLIAGIQPHLIHAGPVQRGGLLPALVKFHPLVVVSWGSDVLCEAEQNEEWLATTRFVLENADYLLCDADSVRCKVQSWTPFPDHRIIQFPWGVELPLFSIQPNEALRQSWGWGGDFVVIITRPYQLETMLTAFARAHAAEPCIKLLVLGGTLQRRVTTWALEHGLSAHVHAVGQIAHDTIAQYFRAADCYVSCSPSDGTSISLLEAMACGLPVVVANSPGNREWVVEPTNGWLTDPVSPEAVAACLCAAAQMNAQSRQAMCHANRAMVAECADWEQNIQRLLSVYGKIAASQDHVSVGGRL